MAAESASTVESLEVEQGTRRKSFVERIIGRASTSRSATNITPGDPKGGHSKKTKSDTTPSTDTRKTSTCSLAKPPEAKRRKSFIELLARGADTRGSDILTLDIYKDFITEEDEEETEDEEEEKQERERDVESDKASRKASFESTSSAHGTNKRKKTITFADTDSTNLSHGRDNPSFEENVDDNESTKSRPSLETISESGAPKHRRPSNSRRGTVPENRRMSYVEALVKGADNPRRRSLIQVIAGSSAHMSPIAFSAAAAAAERQSRRASVMSNSDSEGKERRRSSLKVQSAEANQSHSSDAVEEGRDNQTPSSSIQSRRKSSSVRHRLSTTDTERRQSVRSQRKKSFVMALATGIDNPRKRSIFEVMARGADMGPSSIGAELQHSEQLKYEINHPDVEFYDWKLGERRRSSFVSGCAEDAVRSASLAVPSAEPRRSIVDILTGKGGEDREGNPIEPRVYIRRWFILAMFFVTALTNSAQWIEYSSVSHVIAEFYSIRIETVDWFSMIYMAAYIPLLAPVSWLLTRKDLRIAAVMGAFGNAVGAIIKCASLSPGRLWVAFVAQFFCAFSQTFILGMPANLAAVWFGPSEVSIACAIGVFGYQMGIALGFILPPIFVASDPERATQSLSLYLYGMAGCTSVTLILVVFAFRGCPTIPPSKAQVTVLGDSTPQSYKASVKNLIKNPGYVMLMITYGMNIGTFFAFITLLNRVVIFYFPGHEKYIGEMGLTFVIAGLFGSIMSGIVLDRTRRFKWTAFWLYMFSLFGMIIFTFTLNQGKIWVVFVSCGILGYFMQGYLPLGFDFAAELTYPESLIASSSLLNACAQAFGVVLTLVAGKLIGRFSVMAGNIFLCVILGLGALGTWCIKEDLRRQKAAEAFLADDNDSIYFDSQQDENDVESMIEIPAVTITREQLRLGQIENCEANGDVVTQRLSKTSTDIPEIVVTFCSDDDEAPEDHVKQAHGPMTSIDEEQPTDDNAVSTSPGADSQQNNEKEPHVDPHEQNAYNETKLNKEAPEAVTVGDTGETDAIQCTRL